MGSRVRRPEVERLELSRGDFAIVKRYLTAGEYRQMLRESTKPIALRPGTDALTFQKGATMELDPVAAGLALVAAYLLDWSFTDPDGRPIVIADQPGHVVRAALDRIDADAYMELQRVIQTHQSNMEAEAELEKKILSSPIDSLST